MYCKYLSKCLNGKIKCKLNKTYISYLIDCKNCSKRILVKNKPIKKISNKQKQLNKNRFSVLTNNFEQCYYCHKREKNNEKFDLHEVYGGSNRIRSIKNGFVVPLCRICHSNETIIQTLRLRIQKEYEKTHSRQDFINIIGKSYMKE